MQTQDTSVQHAALGTVIEDTVDRTRLAMMQIAHSMAGMRVIMDPYGDDHDVLIEKQPDHWNVLVHPAGQDPICCVCLYPDRVVVEDVMGNKLIEANWSKETK